MRIRFLVHEVKRRRNVPWIGGLLTGLETSRRKEERENQDGRISDD